LYSRVSAFLKLYFFIVILSIIPYNKYYQAEQKVNNIKVVLK